MFIHLDRLKMVRCDYQKMVINVWLKDQFPYIDLISYIVMPDHVHGIIHINTDFIIKLRGRVKCREQSKWKCRERSRPFPTIDSAESNDSNNSQNKTINGIDWCI